MGILTDRLEAATFSAAACTTAADDTGLGRDGDDEGVGAGSEVGVVGVCACTGDDWNEVRRCDEPGRPEPGREPDRPEPEGRVGVIIR